MISEADLRKEFVYDGRMVRLTGRYTEQKKRASGNTTLLVEICPQSIALTSPNNVNYNKWVKRSLLLDVMGKHTLFDIISSEKTPKSEGEPNVTQTPNNP